MNKTLNYENLQTKLIFLYTSRSTAVSMGTHSNLVLAQQDVSGWCIVCVFILILMSCGYSKRGQYFMFRYNINILCLLAKFIKCWYICWVLSDHVRMSNKLNRRWNSNFRIGRNNSEAIIIISNYVGGPQISNKDQQDEAHSNKWRIKLKLSKTFRGQ